MSIIVVSCCALKIKKTTLKHKQVAQIAKENVLKLSVGENFDILSFMDKFRKKNRLVDYRCCVYIIDLKKLKIKKYFVI